MSRKSGFEADCRCSRACDSGIASGGYFVRFGAPGNGSSMISDPGSPALHRRPNLPILNCLTPAQIVPAMPLSGAKGVAGLAGQRPSTSRLSGKLTDAASVLMTRPLTAAMGLGRLSSRDSRPRGNLWRLSLSCFSRCGIREHFCRKLAVDRNRLRSSLRSPVPAKVRRSSRRGAQPIR